MSIPRAIVAIVSLLGAPQTFAQPDVFDTQNAIERIGSDARASFDAVLEQFSAEFDKRPFDVVLRVERCRFLDAFTVDYEYLDWLDDVYELGERCIEEARTEFPDHPEIVLLELERMYDDVALLDAGEKALAKLSSQNWTAGQNARLHTLLANAADRLGNESAARYATRALELDERADVRLIVATSRMAGGDDAGALAVLASPMDPHGSGDEAWYYLTRKMSLLAELEAAAPVVATHAKLLESDGYYDHVEAARALRRVGAFELARQELDLATENMTYSSADERERFVFEYERGSAEQAFGAYDSLRDLGWAEDPLGINRAALFLRHPSLPLRWRDALGLVGLAATIAVIALLVVLPVALVHYRGLVRRARSGAAYPTEGWQLRHGWYAMLALGVGSIIAAYTAGPFDIFAGTPTAWVFDATDPQLAQLAVAESMLLVLLLLPLAWLARTRQPVWWTTTWPIPKALLIGVGVALLFRIPFFLIWAAVPDGIPSMLGEDLVWQMILSVRDRFGFAAALWVLVLVAAVAEEFVFRGVLLKAFSNHIGLGWANVLQAALFAAAHVDLTQTPLLFGLGLAAGGLAKKSGGLVAPMVMHGTFNLVVGLQVLQA
jgi:membrane protease YdiL (CAAX protease family)